MARRRKQDSGGVILVIIMLALVVVVFTVVTSLVYGGMLIFVVGLVSIFIRGLEEPSPPVYLAELPALQLAERRAIAASLEITEQIAHIHVQGKNSGLRLTSQSNNLLFDRRFPEAELLNQQLDILLSKEYNQSTALFDLRDKQERHQATWRSTYSGWQTQMACLRGFRLAAAVYVPTIFAVTVIANGLAFEASTRIANLLWFDNPRLRPYYLALICGTVVSAVTALLSGFSLRSDLAARSRLEASSWLREQEAKTSDAESQRHRDETQASGRSSSGPGRSKRDKAHPGASGHRRGSKAAPTEPLKKPWYEILEISQSATEAEIEKAWKAKVRKNHPDLTGNLEYQFRELAEKRTKEINEARDIGLAHRINK